MNSNTWFLRIYGKADIALQEGANLAEISWFTKVSIGGNIFKNYFIVYFLDDPIIYHAIFIVRCVKATEKMMPADIVAFGRLATTVKKSAVLASLVDDKVSYITVNWIDD